MQRPSVAAAVTGAGAAIALAALINTVLTVLAGDTLVIPGELGVAQVAVFTVVMVIPTALVLWWLPRWLPVIAIAFAVLTLPLPFMEFPTPIGWWLGAMHLITGVSAAIVAPRVAARR